MPSIWKRLSNPKATPYQFPTADEIDLSQDLLAENSPQPQPEPEPDIFSAPKSRDFSAFEEPLSTNVNLRYAQVQAEQILKAAKRQAEDLIAKSRQEIEEEKAAVYEKARKEGFESGHADGYEDGKAQALEEGRASQAEQIEKLSGDIQKFLEKANNNLEQQMENSRDELRELAIAVAEKVIAVSLRSSSEVIGRMIQQAIDKRKRREWVRIYVAESAGHAIKLSPSLTNSLTALSDQVRIIPMADDDPGTCIVEMPDEIVDASASTQINNIRALLSDMSYDDELFNS